MDLESAALYAHTGRLMRASRPMRSVLQMTGKARKGSIRFKDGARLVIRFCSGDATVLLSSCIGLLTSISASFDESSIFGVLGRVRVPS